MLNPRRTDGGARTRPAQDTPGTQGQDMQGQSATAPVWVLDDRPAGVPSAATGVAARLGLPYRRIALRWGALAHALPTPPGGSLLGLADRGRRVAGIAAQAAPGGTKLIVSSGRRAAAVALWLRGRLGCPAVHCMAAGELLVRPSRTPFDLLVVPGHDPVDAAWEPAARLFPVLGVPHAVSPEVLEQAAATWAERLDYLPRPRMALLVGGPARGSDLPPAQAHALGVAVARAAAARGGAVLAATGRRTGTEAADALAAGLGRTMHLIHRWGEPGENPYLGYLALADATVVTAGSEATLSEACASGAAVYVALPELAGARHRRLSASLVATGHVRPFRNEVGTWTRPRLDEAGRVAAELRRRFALG